MDTRLLSIKKTIPVNLVKFVRPLVLLEMDSQKLVWYDLERKKTRRVKIEGAPDTFSAEVFVGSLVPLDNREEEEIKRKKKEELEDEEVERRGMIFYRQDSNWFCDNVEHRYRTWMDRAKSITKNLREGLEVLGLTITSRFRYISIHLAA